MFGDVVVSYERMQEVEFSFFTLPDSGAFLTHAPKRLSEAFALVYPFQMEVWPVVIFTFIVTGPILYLMIAIPQWIVERKNARKRLQQPETFFSLIYIREITREATLRRRVNRTRKSRTDEIVEGKKDSNLFANCVWFTCRIFLRQCKS